MKHLICFLLAGGLLMAAPVTITGTIRKPDNTLATGIATIELTTPCLNVSGNLILDRPLRVPFNAGAFSVVLEPTTVCTVEPFYRVRYQVERVYISAYEYWAVPPSPTTTTIAAVRRENAAPPVFADATTKGDISVFDGIQWKKLARGADGQVLKAASAEATGLKWEADGGGGGGGTQQWTSGTLNFGTLLDMACADQTFAATGLALGTPLLVVPYSGIGVVSVAAWPSATDTAKIRVCNTSGADVAVSGVFTVKQVASGYLAGSGTLDFPLIIAGGSQSLNLTVTGATTAMAALSVPPAALNAGVQLSARVTSSNTVAFTATNLTDADIDPASGSFTGVLIQ